MAKRMLAVIALCLLIGLIAWGILSTSALEKGRLPYDQRNLVLYDNDNANDVYTDEFLLALSSLGAIQLKGMITSSPIAPYDMYVPDVDYQKALADREQLVEQAKLSGFINIPHRTRGPKGHLERPQSGRIEATNPIGAPGSWLIVNEARNASKEKPLVVVVGAPLTAEADAYLLDPSIADKMVIAWLGGDRNSMCDYNGWADPWAAYIVLERLRLVQFPLGMAPPHVPKSRLLSLPASPLTEYMYRKHHPTNSDPRDIDADGPPAISLVRPDYPIIVRHVKFKGWSRCHMHPAREPLSEIHDVPALYPNPFGRVLVVEESDSGVSTDEWWKTLEKALRKPNER